MKRQLLIGAIGGILLVSGSSVLIAMAEQSGGGFFIASDRPVTEDQVSQKLQAEGYSNVQIVRQGQYFDAVGSKDGQATRSLSAHRLGGFALRTMTTTMIDAHRKERPLYGEIHALTQSGMSRSMTPRWIAWAL